MNEEQQNKLIEFSAKATKGLFRKCLFPGIECNENPIKAHSIQNSRVIQLLEKGGHVVMINYKFQGKKKPEMQFKHLGRNLASTFQGLCSKHDSDLFRDIDTLDFDETNEKQLFLLFYRSVVRELYVCIDTALKTQLGYQKRVEMGLEDGATPSDAGLMATNRFMVAYEVHEFKIALDSILSNERYFDISHEIVVLDNQNPTLAGGTPRVGLNVFPVSESKTLVVFSFDTAFKNEVFEFIGPLLTENDNQKYLISRLILSNSENFVISPHYFNNWSLTKKRVILKFFEKTLLHNDHTFQNMHLMLF